MGIPTGHGHHSLLVDDVSRSLRLIRDQSLTAGYTMSRQVGMALGFATAYPVNWLLIKYKIKEPCV